MTNDRNKHQLMAAQVEMLEANIGVVLPSDYRDFIIRCNGSITPLDINIIDIPDAPGSPTDIQVFFGIDRVINSSNIDWNVSLVRERCSDINLVPIACDSGGNLFCLKKNESKYDVVYCDLDTLGCTCYFVASSFNSLLSKLRSFS